MTTLAIIISAIIIFTPFMASMALCVPKWWVEVVNPFIPDWMRPPEEPATLNAWYWAPLRWLGHTLRFILVMLIGVPFFLTIFAVMRYIYAWTTWVERKCPYVAPDRIADYNSQHQCAERWHDSSSGTFGRLWNVAIGRLT